MIRTLIAGLIVLMTIVWWWGQYQNDVPIDQFELYAVALLFAIYIRGEVDRLDGV